MDELNSADFINGVKAANGAAGQSAPNKASGIPLEKAIKSLPYHMQDMAETMFRKELRSPDLSSIRLISLEKQATELANKQTVFLNICESNGIERVTDFQHRFRERNIGSDAAEFFNPNGDFAAEAESNRPTRDNTLGFLGNQLNIRLIAEELASQSPIARTNLVQEEVEHELIRIRRKMNSALISNTEIKAENAANIPQWGGFITRSTLYNLATSGDLTNALIQGRVDAIANNADAQGLTYDAPIMALCHPGQLSKIEDLMIARYPNAQHSIAQEQLNAMLMAGLPNLGIAPQQMAVYKPRPGRPVLFIGESQLPSGYCVFFVPNLPKLGKFQMMGSFGPFVLERPTADLKRIIYCFDAATLVDPLVESRAVLSGLNN